MHESVYFCSYMSSYTLKKSLGQHFLKDESICQDIVAALKKHPFQQVLEVGPGGGALTKYLLEDPSFQFKAVELDQEKIVFLLKTYPSLEGKIISASILDIAPPFEGSFSVVGNFPYNISTQILFKILTWRPQVEQVIGMFQKEVAQRVAAPHGNKVYGIISVLIQAYFDVEYLFDVQENAFTPPPKVKSGVIRLLPREHPVQARSEKDFFQLVKMAFNQRRKMLRNGLKPLFEESVLSEPVFSKRAEQLSIQELADLTFKMKPNRRQADQEASASSLSSDLI